MKKLITLALLTSLTLSTSVFANEGNITYIEVTDETAEVTTISIETPESVEVTTISIETFESTDAVEINVISTENTSGSAINVVPDTKLPVVDRETGEILVPARETAVELGYTVSWNPYEKSITFTKGTDVFKATVGSDKYTYNDKVVFTAPATKIIDNKAYIPTSIVNAMKPAVTTPQIQDPKKSDIK